MRSGDAKMAALGARCSETSQGAMSETTNKPAPEVKKTDRYCPVCGRTTPEALCPSDSTPTVAMRKFSKQPRSYKDGDIVAQRYQITGTLGSGGFAAVYAAEHVGTKQPIALKLLAVGMDGEDYVAMRRFFREARVTAGLTHRNTVRVFDVGQDDDGPLFIAMELLRGTPLNVKLKENAKLQTAMQEDEALNVAIQILGSLSEAHSQQLVHRDLKPANIFLTKDAEGELLVKVLDFGIARTANSSLTAAGAAPGTPAFMSPEQCYADVVDARSDLYAVAILMFACVCSALPFESKDSIQLMTMHAKTPAPDPRTKAKVPLSDGFVACVLKALSKAPDDRFADAEAMIEELQQVRDGTWNGHLAAREMPTVAYPPRLPGRESNITEIVPPSSLHAAKTPAPAPDSTPLVANAQPAAPAAPATSTAATPQSPVESLAIAPARAPSAAVPAVGGTVRPSPTWLLPAALVLLLAGGVAVGLALRDKTPDKLAVSDTSVVAPAPITAPAAPVPPVAPAPIAPAQPTPDAAHQQAKLAADMAEHAETLDKKLDFAAEAARLAPDVAAYAQMLAGFRAQKAAQIQTHPTTAPTEEPKKAAAPKHESAPRVHEAQPSPAKPAKPAAAGLKPALVD